MICTGHGMIARLDRSCCSCGITLGASHHHEASGWITNQCGIWASAHLARHVLTNVLAEQTFNMLRQVTAFQNELALSGKGTLRPKLCKHKLCDVICAAVHHVANLGEVHPRHFFGTNTYHCWRLDNILFGIPEIGVI